MLFVIKHTLGLRIFLIYYLKEKKTMHSSCIGIFFYERYKVIFSHLVFEFFILIFRKKDLLSLLVQNSESKWTRYIQSMTAKTMTFSPTHFINAPARTYRKLPPPIPHFHIPLRHHPLRPPHSAADQFASEITKPPIPAPILIRLIPQEEASDISQGGGISNKMKISPRNSIPMKRLKLLFPKQRIQMWNPP